jgi:trans-aconitate methyltransferase
MKNRDAVEMITKGIRQSGRPQRWADLGCGNGTFTEALAGILPDGSHVVAIDNGFQHLNKAMRDSVTVEFLQADFEHDDLKVSDLDGILLANSLHYVKDKARLIRKLEKYLSADKTFLVVEYDTLHANHWVPYPIDFLHLKELFSNHNYKTITKLSERKSLYGQGNLYSVLIN